MAFGWALTYLALFLLICTSSANTGIKNVNPAIDNGSNRPTFGKRRRFFTAPIRYTVNGTLVNVLFLIETFLKLDSPDCIYEIPGYCLLRIGMAVNMVEEL